MDWICFCMSLIFKKLKKDLYQKINTQSVFNRQNNMKSFTVQNGLLVRNCFPSPVLTYSLVCVVCGNTGRNLSSFVAATDLAGSGGVGSQLRSVSCVSFIKTVREITGCSLFVSAGACFLVLVGTSTNKSCMNPRNDDMMVGFLFRSVWAFLI